LFDNLSPAAVKVAARARFSHARGEREGHPGLALVLCPLLVTGCAHARLNDAHDRLIEKKAAAVSRGCRWLASRQSPDGSLTAPGQHLNVNVWETALALVALLRCDGAAYGGVIAKGFEFLDANWIEAGGLPEAVARRFSPFKSEKAIRLDPGGLVFFDGSMELPKPGVPWKVTLHSRGKSQTVVLSVDEPANFKAGDFSTVPHEVAMALDQLAA